MKRVCCLVLAGLLALSLAGCGEDLVRISTKDTDRTFTDEAPQEMITVYLLIEEQDSTFRTVYTYDDNGCVIESVRYRGDVELNTSQYTYDEAGNCILSVSTRDGKEYLRFETTYDEENRQTTVTRTDEYIKTCTTYEYDQNGNMVRISVQEHDQLLNETIYEYGEGKLFRAYTYGGEQGNTVTRYSYDDQGNNTKIYTESTETWRWISSRSMEYDANGNITRNVYSAPDYEDQMYLYVYNEKGDKCSESYSRGYVEINRTEWSYDEQGRVIEKVQYEKGNVTKRALYSYNEEGCTFVEGTNSKRYIKKEVPKSEAEGFTNTTYYFMGKP